MHELPMFLERFWAEMPQKCFKNLRFLKGFEHVGNVAVALRFCHLDLEALEILLQARLGNLLEDFLSLFSGQPAKKSSRTFLKIS